ncbi:sensor domain-containing diguanylate cyclase [Paenibacillus oenotherae]|uniref:Sensor domain-containing diguanylate cyclase n=2 Tax=Paenibacillus oenotherae TaxID=1435645 RepID=A0ABS7CZZ7_9BACL|nr:sensor domain-containing diguanylate cyclase [Paenibacillus oenotherae]MBW7473163.1 sensor domain-containing diguanylate cyclase [Paenibacillus oenotherae]
MSTLLSITTSSRSTNELEEKIGNTLSEISYQMAENLDHFMWSRAGEIEVISKSDILRKPTDPRRVHEYLEDLKLNFPSFTWVGFLDPQGTIVASTGDILVGKDISARPVYKNALASQFIGDVHDAVLLAKLLPNPTGEPLQFVDISTPVHNAEGELVGVLAAHLSWEWSRQVENSIMKPIQERMEELQILIVSKQDNVVLLGPKAMVGQPLELASIREAQAGNNHWMTEQWPDGRTYLTGYAYGDGYLNYLGLGWTVVVRQPVDVAFESVGELQMSILTIGCLAALLFAMIGWFIAGIVAKPLKRIAVAADRLRSGEQVEIPYQRSYKDIEILSSSLRSLVDNLTRTENALGAMESLAHHDKLTGLPNRIALDSYLDRAIHKAGQNATALTFLYLDLDGFKNINDSLGHAAGDQLLQLVAARLLSCVRDGEIVSRLGGDEFVAILHTSREQAVQEGLRIADEIIRHLNEPFVIEGQEIQIGCSVGGSVWPTDGEDPIATMRLADAALYASKRAGKNRTTFTSTAEDR